MLFIRVLGPSVFSLTLLRELLLFGIYALTYLNARLLTRSHVCGVAAAVALQFSPSIVWESQRELNHSILASAMILATLFAFLRLQPGRWSACVALGIFGGLSILSKYNAALFYAALLLSAISLPELRPRVFNRGMAVGLCLTPLVVFPHFWWAFSHREPALSSG